MRIQSAFVNFLGKFTQQDSANDSSLNRKLIKRSIRELEACSDRELSDLGISRPNIKQMVIQGRNDFENGTDAA